MKLHTFALDERDIKILFAPIRSKEDVVVLLMKSIKLMLLRTPKNDSEIVGNMVLKISKMSRLFFFSENKYFSINFPFTVFEEPERLVFASNLLDDIDHKLTSDVLKVINSEAYSQPCIYTFNDFIAELEEQTAGFWSLIKELLVFEDGYLRYDHDPLRENGKIHPLHHLDMFYSNGSTFKIGTNNPMSTSHLMDLVDTQSDCHFFN